MMMEHFDELVTDRSLHLEDIRTFATQGEAGQPYKNRYWVNAPLAAAVIQASFYSTRQNGLMCWLPSPVVKSGREYGLTLTAVRKMAIQWHQSVPGICQRRCPLL